MQEILVNAYPKSGLTWLIHLLCDLLESPQHDTPGAPLLTWYAVDNGGYILRKRREPYNTGLIGKIVVLIQRDPRDVAVSAMHYRRQTSIRDAMQTLWGACYDFEHCYTGWLGSWLNTKAYTVLTRYEWLHQKPVDELRRIVSELTGNSPTDDRIQQALERQSFENMVTQLGGDRHFMRKGIVGDWRNHFDREAGRIFNGYLGDFMLQQGYIDNLDWWQKL